jgi:hypothetical protein
VDAFFGPGETYSSYVPQEVFDSLPLAKGKDIAQALVLPGDSFDTPSEAAVVGIDLGDAPEDAAWPASHELVNAEGGDAPAWVDTDEDGEPGLTLWPKLPSEQPDDDPRGNGASGYSYLPASVMEVDGNQEIVERAACVSVATRVVTHLQVDVDDCTQMTGVVVNESTQGRVRSCILAPMSDWDADLTCTTDDWENGPPCVEEDGPDNDPIDRLDSDQNQEQSSRATFRMIKIGELGDDVGCAEVREALPVIERSVPSITCRQ